MNLVRKCVQSLVQDSLRIILRHLDLTEYSSWVSPNTSIIKSDLAKQKRC